MEHHYSSLFKLIGSIEANDDFTATEAMNSVLMS